MGRKGGGRRGFMKNISVPDTGQETQDRNREEELPEKDKIEALSEVTELELPADCRMQSNEDGEIHETMSQLRARHVKELKEHKRAVEKLGRKQKDEVDRRTKELRERHAAELSRLKSQLEVCNTVTEAENFGTGNRHSTISGGETGPGAEGISLYGPQETRSKQKSKSQRRREAKAAHEAEREARILAEKEAQGPTERALEEERLMGLLLPLSLSIKEVPADGHCMYRALQDQLLSVPDGEEEAVSGGYKGLRRLAAMHMRKHADEYIPFVVEADEGEQCYEQFENYCKEIENTAAWGGQAELGALANALRRHIEVYSADLGCLEMGTDYKGVKHTLRLCYMRHAYGLGEHYNSVVIASGTSLKLEPEL